MKLVLPILVLLTIVAAFVGGLNSRGDSDGDLLTVVSFERSLAERDVLVRSYGFTGFLPALNRDILKGYKTIDDYARAMEKRDADALDEEMAVFEKSFTKARDEHLTEIYKGGKRDKEYLTHANGVWLAGGGLADATGDPFAGGKSLGKRKTRDSMMREFGLQASAISGNSASVSIDYSGTFCGHDASTTFDGTYTFRKRRCCKFPGSLC